MRVHYKGSIEALTPEQLKQLDEYYANLGKLMDGKGEKEGHMILTSERHLTRAELTVNYLDHGLVGHGTDADLFTALCHAAGALEKQVVKLKQKRRDSYRQGNDKFQDVARDVPLDSDLHRQEDQEAKLKPE